jgi:predicted RecA/RadA family phage recombinase
VRWGWLLVPAALALVGAAEFDSGHLVSGGGMLAFAVAVYRQGERGIERLDHVIELLGGAPRSRRRRSEPS